MKTIVFAGPTIGETEIKRYLPEACIHAPVQNGDIARVLRLQPARLLIIDGYYENTAAVWHKEILLALQLGIEVVGCASLGALRAAELDRFGMSGIGDIYRDYHQQVLTDDDEVAVLHLDAQHHYQEMNEPMVNIRASLRHACQQKIINENEEFIIVQQAKKLFYPQRHYPVILANAEQILHRSLHDLNQWLTTNKINQKHRDAQTALQWAASHPPQKQNPQFELQDTVYLKRLILQCNSSVFAKTYDWLPTIEKQLQAATLTKGVPQLAVMLNLVDCYGKTDGNIEPLCQWLWSQKKRLKLSMELMKPFQKLLRVFFPKLSEAQRNLFALTFFVLDALLSEKSIDCRSDAITHYRRWLLNHLELKNRQDYQQWLINNDLQETEFTSLTRKIVRYRVAYHYFLGLFLADIPTIASKNWLALACSPDINDYFAMVWQD